MTTDKSMFAYFNEGTAHLPRTNRTVSFYGRELTLGEVMAEIDGFAARLTEIGVGKGDNVIICLGNIPDAVIAFYAVNKIGAIANLVHPLVTASRLVQIARTMHSKAAVLFDEFYGGYDGWEELGVKTFIASAADYLPRVEGFACMFGIMLGMLGLWLGSLIEREKMHRLFKFAVFAVAFAAAAVVVMQVMKNIWCRMRYRDMLKAGSEDGFTPWYKIMFGREDMIEDGDYTSFPSGHTSSAAHIFLFAALCDIIPGWDRKGVRIGVNIGCTAFTVVVAISRIVANAHFLSDVLVGGYLTYLIFVALRRAFFGKGKYNFAIALPKEEKKE